MPNNSSPYGNSINNLCFIFDAKTQKIITFSTDNEFKQFFSNPNSTFLINFVGTNYFVKNFMFMEESKSIISKIRVLYDKNGTAIIFDNEVSVSKIKLILLSAEKRSINFVSSAKRGYIFITNLIERINADSNTDTKLTLNPEGFFIEFAE